MNINADKIACILHYKMERYFYQKVPFCFIKSVSWKLDYNGTAQGNEFISPVSFAFLACKKFVSR